MHASAACRTSPAALAALVGAALLLPPSTAPANPATPVEASRPADPDTVAMARRLIAAGSAARFERMIAQERERFRKEWSKANKGRDAEVDRLFAEVALPMLLAKREALLDAQAAFTAARMSRADLEAALAMQDSPAVAALRRLEQDTSFTEEMQDAMAEEIGLFGGIGLARKGSHLEDLLKRAGLDGED